MFEINKVIKKLKSEGSSQIAEPEARGTFLCQLILISIFVVSVEILIWLWNWSENYNKFDLFK